MCGCVCVCVRACARARFLFYISLSHVQHSKKQRRNTQIHAQRKGSHHATWPRLRSSTQCDKTVSAAATAVVSLEPRSAVAFSMILILFLYPPCCCSARRRFITSISWSISHRSGTRSNPNLTNSGRMSTNLTYSGRIPNVRHRNWGHRALGALKMPPSSTLTRSPRLRSHLSIPPYVLPQVCLKMPPFSLLTTQVCLKMPPSSTMTRSPRLRSCLCKLLPTAAGRSAIFLCARHKTACSCDLNSWSS